jgi:hypothetical protein
MFRNKQSHVAYENIVITSLPEPRTSNTLLRPSVDAFINDKSKKK